MYLDGPGWLYIGSTPFVAMGLLFAFQLAREQHAGLVSLRGGGAMRESEELYRLLVQNQPALLIEWTPRWADYIRQRGSPAHRQRAGC